MITGFLGLIDQSRDLLAQNAEYDKLHMGGAAEAVSDCCGRIDRVRKILLKQERLAGGIPSGGENRCGELLHIGGGCAFDCSQKELISGHGQRVSRLGNKEHSPRKPWVPQRIRLENVDFVE